MRDVAVLIPAGGIGARLGRRTPKQFLRVGGEAILTATVRHFRRHPRLAAIVVAVPEAHVPRARRLLGPGVSVVTGGATRQESVRLALDGAPHGVRVVPGLAANVKITTLDDLRRARVKRSARERA